MMSAAVGFVGVLRRAGPHRSKRVRVDALNMCGPLGFTRMRHHFGFGDQWRYSTYKKLWTLVRPKGNYAWAMHFDIPGAV